MDEKRFTIEDVFAMVRDGGIVFGGKIALVGGERIPLTDFILRCVSEEMKQRYIGDDDNEKRVVEQALEKGGYDEYVIPTGDVEGLGAIIGGRRKSRKTRRNR